LPTRCLEHDPFFDLFGSFVLSFDGQTRAGVPAVMMSRCWFSVFCFFPFFWENIQFPRRCRRFRGHDIRCLWSSSFFLPIVPRTHFFQSGVYDGLGELRFRGQADSTFRRNWFADLVCCRRVSFTLRRPSQRAKVLGRPACDFVLTSHPTGLQGVPLSCAVVGGCF